MGTMQRILFVALLQALLIDQGAGFKCQTCSYSYDVSNPGADMACVYQPEIYTGYQVVDCENNCIVQEIYNKVLQKVVAYWRSCTDKVYSDSCTGNQLQTCIYLCQGDNCNSWVRGQLHDIYKNDAIGSQPAHMTLIYMLIGWITLIGLSL